MRIAVTGQNGQVARALGEIAGRHGHEVVLLGRPALDFADASTKRTLCQRLIPAASPMLPSVVRLLRRYYAESDGRSR